MAGIRWLETDTASNQNISSAAACGAYTAAADRAIMVQVLVDQVAGNGDYVMYCTLQIGGAGSAYVILPKTTMTAASGETAIGGQSGWINVRNGDVVTVYVDGLAGDTTTPDYTTRWFEDAALQPTTADRTLDVAATGEAGLDFDNIKAATAPTTLTNITVPTVTTTATATALTTNNDKTGYSLTVTPPTANAIADQVWDEINATHAIAGSTGANLTTAASASGATPASLWAYSSRTLTQTAAQVAAAIAGSDITILRGDTVTIALTGLGALTGYVSLDWTVKADVGDVDSAAILRVRKNASGLLDGLITINGATATTAAQASITIDDAALGNITITLTDDATVQLSPRRGLVYDVQMITATTTRTLTDGDATITGDVTRTLI